MFQRIRQLFKIQQKFPNCYRNFSEKFQPPIENSRDGSFKKLIFGLTAIGGVTGFYLYRNKIQNFKEKSCPLVRHHKYVRKDLPTYSKDQVKENTSDVWVTYGRGVYRLKEYVDEHPGGGEMILMAAGADLDPFWHHKFKFHKKPEILETLESMRIGNLDENDAIALKKEHRCKPTKHIPKVDPEKYRLEIVTKEETLKSLKLEDLKSYPKFSITSSIPCKTDSNKMDKGSTWSGARLRDILRDMNIQNETDLRFECLDTNEKSSLNLPVDKVLQDPDMDVLLAYEMNGFEITPEHGYPVRVVAPKLPGSKNVKWLGRIVFTKNQTENA